MCLAVPGKIIKLERTTAQVDYGGAVRSASIDLKPSAKVGDFVLVHAGFVIEIMEENDAKETIELIEEAFSKANDAK